MRIMYIMLNYENIPSTPISLLSDSIGTMLIVTPVIIWFRIHRKYALMSDHSGCYPLSVIVPVLNEAALLEQRLNYFKQLADKTELVFVDGGSSDNSVQLLQSFDFTVLDCEIKRSRGGQIATGIEYCNQANVCIHHIDTVLGDSACVHILAVLERHDWGRFDVKIDSPQWPFRVIERAMNWRSHLTAIATGDQCIFAKRALLIPCALADYPLMEDIYLSSQLRKISPPRRISEPVLISARYWQRHGVIKTLIKMWWFRLQFYFGVSANNLYKKYYS